MKTILSFIFSLALSFGSLAQTFPQNTGTQDSTNLGGISIQPGGSNQSGCQLGVNQWWYQIGYVGRSHGGFNTHKCPIVVSFSFSTGNGGGVLYVNGAAVGYVGGDLNNTGQLTAVVPSGQYFYALQTAGDGGIYMSIMLDPNN
jgi:hypothetical protein